MVCGQVTSAWRKGRVDAVVQSTDKNFMVPVGGAVVAASKQDPSLVAAVNKVTSSSYNQWSCICQGLHSSDEVPLPSSLHNGRWHDRRYCCGCRFTLAEPP